MTVDDQARRLVYAVVGGRPSHHNASFQVFADGEGHSRVVWITDVLPHEVAKPIGEMVDAGMAVMKRTLETTRAHG